MDENECEINYYIFKISPIQAKLIKTILIMWSSYKYHLPKMTPLFLIVIAGMNIIEKLCKNKETTTQIFFLFLQGRKEIKHNYTADSLKRMAEINSDAGADFVFYFFF